MLTDLAARICDSGFSEDYDSIPLRLRLSLLRSRAHNLDDANLAAAVSDEFCKSRPNGISFDRIEDEHLNAEDRTSMELAVSSSNTPTSYTGVNVVRSEKLGKTVHSLNSPSSDIYPNVDIYLQDGLLASHNAYMQGTKVKKEKSCEFDDTLDNIVLSERRRVLLSRRLLKSSESYMGDKGLSGGAANSPKVLFHNVQKSDSVQAVQTAEHMNPGMDDVNGASHLMNQCPSTLSAELCGSVSIGSRVTCCPSVSKCFTEQEINATDVDAVGNIALPLLAKVKDEPVDVSEPCNEETNGRESLFTSEILPVKAELKKEPEFHELFGDELDDVPLIDRMVLLSSATLSLNASQNLEFKTQNVALALDFGTDTLESVEPIGIGLPQKRKRTATDSVEIALEEDAPGLLKVLMDRGVSVDDMKLYGEGESDDTLDDSLGEGFTELEAVISQLFSQRQPFMKFSILRCAKGARASYCLSCLLALVEQTRYLQHRKWPVEWGWCRDLHSFIFVFQRHNRIVLERPEYGFATYFFELLNSVPVDWQLKRLVTVMKLTSCGRITLLENKPLMVGEDLSDGEARVLAQFGWTPNTGLGTMLNYCDRVVHDRKQERDSSEWRSKIAKQLMNGYNGGNIVSKSLPSKLGEHEGSQSIEVKLEQ